MSGCCFMLLHVEIELSGIICWRDIPFSGEWFKYINQKPVGCKCVFSEVSLWFHFLICPFLLSCQVFLIITVRGVFEIKYYFQVSFLLLKFAGAMWCIYIWILGFFVLNANRIPFIFWLCSQWVDWLLWELRIFWFYYYFQSIEMGMFFHFLFPWAIKY